MLDIVPDEDKVVTAIGFNHPAESDGGPGISGAPSLPWPCGQYPSEPIQPRPVLGDIDDPISLSQALRSFRSNSAGVL